MRPPTFGAWIDHGRTGTGESAGWLLRAGSAGSNTTADHQVMLTQVLEQLPPGQREPHADGWRPVLVRTDAAGATHGFATILHREGLAFSLGAPVGTLPQVAALLAEMPAEAWTRAYNADGRPRDRAWVAEVTEAIDLSAWPEGTRLILRVNRPDRALRRRKGKSDALDAYAAAEAAASGRAATTPKDHTGPVEAIRVLRETRDGAIKARTAAINTLKSLITTGAEPLRHALTGLGRTQLLTTCAALPEQDHADDAATQATITALTSHATRIQTLNTEIAALDQQLHTLVRDTAPTTTAIYGAGTETAGQLLITAGHNIDRLHSEAALAALTGASPIPASSGKLDIICVALGCEVPELLIPEPHTVARFTQDQQDAAAVASSGPRVVPKRRDGRSLPPI